MTSNKSHPLKYKHVEKELAIDHKRKCNHGFLFIGGTILLLLYLVARAPEPLAPKGPVCTAAPMNIQPYP